MSDEPWPRIKACVFDAYGTLFDVHSAAAKLSDRIGTNSEALSNLWRQKQLEYTWLRALMPAHRDFWQVTGDALDYAMEAYGLIDPDLREQLMELYLRLDAYAEVPDCLQRLKDAGVKTAILSNGEPKMLGAAVESAGLSALLDDVQSVEEVGVYKPHPKVYQLSVDRLGVEPAEICFVSSNTWDAAGAAHFGFSVCWLNRFAKQWDRLPGDPKAVIHTLDELPVPATREPDKREEETA
jgi:2-haloacid dehalogenase